MAIRAPDGANKVVYRVAQKKFLIEIRISRWGPLKKFKSEQVLAIGTKTLLHRWKCTSHLLVTTGFDLKLFDGAILISIRKFGNSVSFFLD